MLPVFRFSRELMDMTFRYGINRCDTFFCLNYHLIGSFLKIIFYLLILLGKYIYTV